MTTLEKTIQNMKGKILDIPDYKYSNQSPTSVKLNDKMVIYNTGNKWKIVPLKLMLSYPIIYDKYTVDNDKNETYDVTLVLCPITLRCVMFKGLFEFETYDNMRMILREKGKNVLLPVDLNIKINDEYILEKNKRLETMIVTLRNSLIIAPDSLHLECDKKIDCVMSEKYYNNTLDLEENELDFLIHPKTLVYVIQYKSADEEKVTIVIGKDS